MPSRQVPKSSTLSMPLKRATKLRAAVAPARLSMSAKTGTKALDTAIVEHPAEGISRERRSGASFRAPAGIGCRPLLGLTGHRGGASYADPNDWIFGEYRGDSRFRQEEDPTDRAPHCAQPPSAEH